VDALESAGETQQATAVAVPFRVGSRTP